MSSTKSITDKEVQTLIQGKLSRYYGVSPKEASIDQIYKAVVMSVRDILLEKRQQFHKVMMSKKGKRVYYLCMEFLLGRSLKNNIYNLGLQEAYGTAVKSFGLRSKICTSANRMQGSERRIGQARRLLHGRFGDGQLSCDGVFDLL